ncbi:hypothetical protein QEN19_002789 [Hanseniaspora menglaensis]
MNRRSKSFLKEYSESSVIENSFDGSISFSNNNDNSYLFHKVNGEKYIDDEVLDCADNESKNIYTDEGVDEEHQVINNISYLNDDTIIDIRREKRYNYGIATVYLILFLTIASVFTNQIIQYLDRSNLSDAFLVRQGHLISEAMVNEKIEKLNLENKMLWSKLNTLQEKLIQSHTSELRGLDEKIRSLNDTFIAHDKIVQNISVGGELSNKKIMSDAQEVRKELEPINYMNYKFGSKLIKEWTSETYKSLPLNLVDSLDLLSPVYINDHTMNWPCEIEKDERYCKVGIHLGNSLVIKKIFYNSICGENKIEMFSLDELTQTIKLLGSVKLNGYEEDCENEFKKILLFDNNQFLEKHENLIFKIYSKDSKSRHLLINSFIIN